MPITGGRKTAGNARLTERAKRLVGLAFLIAGLMVVSDLAGFLPGSLAALSGGPQRSRVVQTPLVTINDCSFLRDPESFRGVQARHRTAVSRATESVSGRLQGEEASAGLMQAQDVPRRNFIDVILFDRMTRDGVASAPLCSDAEFVRRAYLDITGRIPAADDVTNFLNDTNPSKRDALVDTLIASPEFVDKWTMFFNDKLKNTSFSTNINRYIGGRDAFYKYIRDSIANNKGYDQMATEMITANGDSYVDGAVNFIVGGNVPMGPGQDTMDGLAVQTSATFLGISSMDCLLCHDGAGHLNAVNLWGAQQKRADAWGMAAFFARTNRAQTTVSTTPQYIKYTISERTTGEYQLNTTVGNRTARTAVNGKNMSDPKYMFTGAGITAGENRRVALARFITADPQFARATVNYIWEKLMAEGLVSPSSSFDPARLSPTAQMPEGWALQPANAELLEALAQEFSRDSFNLRNLIATIVKSSAYQLSSQYPGTWRLDYVPYYARKYVRRLDAEEAHDAITKATGMMPSYELRADDGVTVTGLVKWAMQLPEPREPRRDGTGRLFLDSFLRGDRDQKLRTDDPSILQALNMMNNSFVMGRIHKGNAGSTVAKLLADAAATPEQLITQLYLNTLSRKPSAAEVTKLTPYFTSLGKQAATESLQWALLNKVDFLFNY